MVTLTGTEWQLLYPQLLWLLLPVWWLAWLWRRYTTSSVKQNFVLRLPGIELLPAEMEGRANSNILPWALYVLGLSCMVLALSRPQSIGAVVELPAEGREFVLIVDTSQSMGVRDFRADANNVARIDVLKGIVNRFVQARKGDHFSLIAFSSQAATLVPMTPDRELLTAQLNRLQLGILGDDTAIGHALALAVKQLKTKPTTAPVFILFSDGENTTGQLTPREALLLARDVGARVYAVAITGADEKLPEAVTEPGLRDITRLTGGRFYHASDSQALETMIANVDRLEKTIKPEGKQHDVREWYSTILLIAAIFLVMSAVLNNLERR